jgi:glycosyltransferase involved in cell wall biosynthesis
MPEITADTATPLVTVGMTTYNNPHGLREALDCIVNQTYRNLEIIISEDCSPVEETGNVLREYAGKDPRIRVIHQATNLGPPTNINFVLTQASGEYFMWADDDDLRDTTWIEALLPKLLGKGVIAALGNVVAINDGGEPTQVCRPIQFAGPRLLRLAGYFLTEESGGKACIVSGLFRTAFLRTIKPWGQYAVNKYGFGDHYFNLDCLQYGDVIADQSVTIYKRLPTQAYSKAGGAGIRNRIGRIFTRLRCLSGYSMVLKRWSDKLVILLLLPVRILKTVLLHISRSLFGKRGEPGSG